MDSKPDKRFLRPWANKTDGHVVLGRRLHPFCLLDMVALLSYESPLLCGGPVGIDDVMIAVEVCSTEYKTLEVPSQAPLNAASYLKELAKTTPALEHAKFQAYLDDYWTRIEVAAAQGNGKPLGQPAWISMVLTLVKNGFREWDVYTRPFGQVQAYYHGLQELLTDAQIMTEEQQDVIDAAPEPTP